MRTVSLSGSLRTNVGSKDAAQLRAKGLVPCVVYGGKEQVHFSVEERQFKPIIYTPEACVVEINVDGKQFKTVLQDSQYHKITDQIIHADFLEILPGKAVTMAIPVKLHGQSKGVKDGGKLVQKFRKMNLRGLIEKMPQNIDINIEDLAIGKSITPADISIDGITILHPSNISIVSVASTRNAVEETPAAGAPAAKK
ncbi:MAG: 50S ribosomal protein L25 [Bacteroidota bacterium]|jgi:large subunit ribosomal protein L25